MVLGGMVLGGMVLGGMVLGGMVLGGMVLGGMVLGGKVLWRSAPSASAGGVDDDAVAGLHRGGVFRAEVDGTFDRRRRRLGLELRR